jgi:hypothetical protein
MVRGAAGAAEHGFTGCLPRNAFNESESSQRHASPRSDPIPSKYPIISIRK